MTREQKFNILRGIVMGSHLDNKEKREILEFVNELEEPLDWSEEE